jgi:hypothetical protein
MPEGPVQPPGFGDQLDPAAVGVQQPNGLVERALQDVARVPDGGDARGDLAEGSLGLDPSLELLVQARVAQHDGRLAGQRAQQLRVIAVERVDPRGVGGDRPQRATFADQRGAHLGVVAEALDPLVGLRGMGEGLILEVVPRPRHLGLLDRLARDALPDADRHLVHGRGVGAGVEDLSVIGQLSGAGPDLVDDQVFGTEQPLGLGHGAPQDG